MREGRRSFWLLVGLVAACPCNAQEDISAGFSLQQKFELPAHQRLIDLIRSDGITLAEFSTDGCSGGMSGTWRALADISLNFAESHSDLPPWEECCVIHDQVYHNAGAAQDAQSSFDARLNADLDLRRCVVEVGNTRNSELAKQYSVSQERVTAAYKLIAGSMFNAVRLGGGPCSGLPWRWGYGYPGCFWNSSEN